jgi:hypothetical protein
MNEEMQSAGEIGDCAWWVYATDMGKRCREVFRISVACLTGERGATQRAAVHALWARRSRMAVKVE